VRSGAADVGSCILLFGPFWADATWTLLKRLAAGKKVWEPHREHAYQRVVLLGWSHRETLFLSYALIAAYATGAIASVFAPDARAGIFGGFALLFAAVLARLRRLERRRS
jgi:hypothetical protein